MARLIHAILYFVFLMTAGYALADGSLFQDPEEFDAAWPPLMEEVSIPSHGELLTGTFYTAAGEGPHPTIVMLHAFPGYEKNLDLAQSLRPYNVSFCWRVGHYRKCYRQCRP